MLAPDPQRLLAVWEHGARRHPIDRALLLFSLAVPQRPVNTLADAPLGIRNASLLELRDACFDAPLAAWVDCPACGERMSIDLDRAQLPSAPRETAEPIEVGGHRFHRPTSRHLARLADTTDTDAAARQLLRDCADAADALPQDDGALDALLANVEKALDDADPWSDLSIALSCPACGHDSAASFDIAGYLWEEIDSHAKALLDDIHTLASAYGWTEPEILALSAARRAAYLERVRE